LAQQTSSPARKAATDLLATVDAVDPAKAHGRGKMGAQAVGLTAVTNGFEEAETVFNQPCQNF
jgi:hypothetical protein